VYRRVRPASYPNNKIGLPQPRATLDDRQVT
jgi:hypothetical protein